MKTELTTKHEGEQLQKFLTTLKYSNSYVAEVLDVSMTTIANHFKQKFLKKILKDVYYLNFGIHPDSFKKDKLVQEAKEGKDLLISPALIQYRNYHEYLELYFKTICENIGKAKQSIIIVDYGKNNFQAANSFKRSQYHDTYHRLFGQYLEKVEGVILSSKNPSKFAYRKYFQTPVRNTRAPLFKNDRLLQGIDLIYLSSMKHYARLINRDIDMRFYLVSEAVRPNSYMILDEKIILSEYIKYYQEHSRPDSLFVGYKTGRPNCINSKLIKAYKGEMHADRIGNEGKVKLTPEVLYLQLKKIKPAYQEAILTLEEELKRSAENVEDKQSLLQFYKGRVDRTQKKIEVVESLLKK